MNKIQVDWFSEKTKSLNEVQLGNMMCNMMGNIKANHLIVKARKYFSIMQLVCFELFFSVRRTFARFFSCFTNFPLLKVFKVFQWLNVVLLVFQGFKANNKPIKRFHYKSYFNMWVNQLWQSHPFKEYIYIIYTYISIMGNLPQCGANKTASLEKFIDKRNRN